MAAVKQAESLSLLTCLPAWTKGIIIRTDELGAAAYHAHVQSLMHELIREALPLVLGDLS